MIQLDELDKQLQTLEREGRTLEDKIRSGMLLLPI